MAQFIPGTLASAVNFKVYLLDGITRWNADRAKAVIALPRSVLQTFDTRRQDRLNVLSKAFYGESVFPDFRPPAHYRGESCLAWPTCTVPLRSVL